VDCIGGHSSGALVGADRVNPNKFYGFLNGRFYSSTNGGLSFSASAASGLPTGAARFKAVPGREGDIWLAGGTEGGVYGLWRSIDNGGSFTRLANVQEADAVGFGRAAASQTYPALYASAQIDNVRGIFRSDDGGVSWVRVIDDQHQFASTGAAITGDPRVYGRVYVSTNGRGVIVGEPAAGGTPTATPSPAPSTATPTRTPTSAPQATSTPTPTRTATPGPGGGCTLTYTITNQWNNTASSGGFQADLSIRNTGRRNHQRLDADVRLRQRPDDPAVVERRLQPGGRQRDRHLHSAVERNDRPRGHGRRRRLHGHLDRRQHQARASCRERERVQRGLAQRKDTQSHRRSHPQRDARHLKAMVEYATDGQTPTSGSG
jgi:hypothetical protein